MNEVEAVKNIDDVRTISRFLLKHNGQVFADVWDMGLQLALRISDLLSLTYDDVKNGEVVIREGKTGKVAKIPLNSKAQSIIDRIIATYPDGTYLFQSRNSRNVKTVKPITRQAVGQAFKEAGNVVGVQLGTHSMRKTRGYILYKQTNDLARVMKMLRHSSQAETLRYIGIDADTVANDFMQVVL